MIRSRFLIIIVSLATVVLLESCISTDLKGPTTPEDTLVVGTIRMVIHNLGLKGGVNLNGTHRHGIELEILRLDSGEKLRVKSFGRYGFFYIPSLQAGHYKITRLYFKKTVNKRRAAIWNHPRAFRFKVQSNTVNNLGEIIWYAEWEGSGPYSARQTRNFESIKQLFSLRYPESAWLCVEWSDIDPY